MKRTYQPSKVRRARTHGFLVRMKTRGGRNVIATHLGELMRRESSLLLSRADIITYARSLIDVIVQLERRDGQRSIVEIAPVSQMA